MNRDRDRDDTEARPLEPGRPGFPTTAAEFRAFLGERGWRPSRRLGQNFLLGTAAHARIAAIADLNADDRVVEIGCGLGGLTRCLAARAGFVRGAEIDRRLLAACQEFFPPSDRLHYHAGDCLHGKHELDATLRAVLVADRARGFAREKWVANLPYSVAGPLIAILLSTDPAPERVIVMVQTEVAARLVAPPGGADYGPLAILAKLAADVEFAGSYPPSAFWPRPEVHSTLVDMRLRALRDPDLAKLARFLPALFGQRRKTLAGGVAILASGKDDGDSPDLQFGAGWRGKRPAAVADILRHSGFDPACRAETLPPDALLELMRLSQNDL